MPWPMRVGCALSPVVQATFYVLSDPGAIKYVLSTRFQDFDKGLLAEILSPILGKVSSPRSLLPDPWQSVLCVLLRVLCTR
jgi:hypothetical protein